MGAVNTDLAMIIHDGDLLRSADRPLENDSPLVIDADGMEARKIAFEGFQAVAGWHGHILQCPGLI